MTVSSHQPEGPHAAVMLNEVLHYMAVEKDKIYCDGTFGAGGYSEALLAQAPCHVVAIDRDPGARQFAEQLQQRYPGRLTFISGCFGDALELVNRAGITGLDGMVLDIGVSSMQLDQAERGFSLKQDGPLDMRMAQQGQSAADLVNEADEDELRSIIARYGEERHARRVARAIIHARQEEPITTTGRLQEIVASALPKGKEKIHPATRTFQALRIAVNDELGELERGLEASLHLLKPGGRLVVVTFHSLEDRIVKQFMHQHSGTVPSTSRHMPELAVPPALLSMLHKGVVKVSQEEAEQNPRARSAKLRAAERTEVPYAA